MTSCIVPAAQITRHLKASDLTEGDKLAIHVAGSKELELTVPDDVEWHNILITINYEQSDVA